MIALPHPAPPRNSAQLPVSGILFALLLHALLILVVLHGQFGPSRSLERRVLTVIELQPERRAPAVAAIASPAESAAKPKPDAQQPHSNVAPPRPVRAKAIRSAPPQQPRVMASKSAPVLSAAAASVAPPAPAVTRPATASLPAVSPPPLAPPVTASSGRVARMPFDYLWEVSADVGQHRIYPLSARDARQQGTAVIHIHLRRDGSLLDVTLLKSSGYPVLDEAARDAVLHVGRFPVLPDEFSPGLNDFAIDQPISFRLE